MKPQASNLTLYPIITRELKFFAVDDELESTLYQEIPTVHLGNEMQRDGNQTTLREKKNRKEKRRWHAQVPLVRRHGTSTTQLTKTIHTQSIHMEKRIGHFVSKLSTSPGLEVERRVFSSPFG
jgi:hypothetical protein